MKTGLKIIYINGRFLTRPLTGVERTAYELLRQLDNLLDSGLGHENRKYIVIYSGKLVNPIKLKCIQLLKKGWLTGNLWEQVELPFYTSGHLLVSLCTITSLLKRKQLLMVHDAAFMANPQFFPALLRAWYRNAVPYLGKRICHLITVSEFSKKELIKYFDLEANRISVIYNAADHLLRFAEPDEDFKRTVIQSKPYVLAVSSLAANKNFKGLSAAINKIDFKEYKMLLAGGVVSTLQHEAPLSAVTYLGYVSNEELKFLYANASLFVFPSFYEGFGIPPLEAMISGCPVLSSNTSALPEVLGQACEYFNPYNKDELPEKMQSLLHDEQQLKSLVQRGYKQAALYDWERSANQLYLLIEKYAC